MLETYFVAPKTLQRLRAGLSGLYMDGFAAALEQDGYSRASAIRYLRAAAHLGHFLQGQGASLALQLQVPFEVRFLGHGLMTSAPDGPGDDESRFDTALDQ